MSKLLRIRFKANEDDYRSVNWPVKYPYWCSGCGNDHSIVITYADSVDYVMTNWPEASDLQIDEVDKITFSDRFPKPDWYTETGRQLKYSEHTAWGNKISILDWEANKFCAWTTPIINVGDEIIFEMKSGTVKAFLVAEVEPCHDPKDMVFFTLNKNGRLIK